MKRRGRRATIPAVTNRMTSPQEFLTTVALSLLLLAGAAMSGEVRLYVSPSGNDADPGTEQRPFATPQRARDAVRELKKTHPKTNITVLFRGGVYRLTDTLVFSLEDSGSPGQTITYTAYPGEKVILSGAVPAVSYTHLTLPTKAYV